MDTLTIAHQPSIIATNQDALSLERARLLRQKRRLETIKREAINELSDIDKRLNEIESARIALDNAA